MEDNTQAKKEEALLSALDEELKGIESTVETDQFIVDYGETLKEFKAGDRLEDSIIAFAKLIEDHIVYISTGMSRIVIELLSANTKEEEIVSSVARVYGMVSQICVKEIGMAEDCEACRKISLNALVIKESIPDLLGDDDARKDVNYYTRYLVADFMITFRAMNRHFLDHVVA